MDTTILFLVGMLLILVALAALGIVRLLRGKSSPPVQAIIDALQPYIFKAIYSGAELARIAAEQFEQKLDGTNRAAVANTMYDLLPDHLLVAGWPIPIGIVKGVVSREKFGELVEDTYRTTRAFIEREKVNLLSQVEALQPGQQLTGGGGTGQS